MIRNLKDALVAQQATLESTQKIHQAEMEQLRKQISDLQTANGQLRLQNDQLKVLTHDRHVIEALHPQIQKNQEQLASFSTLLNTLYELTKAKPIPEVLNSTEINAQRPVTEPITGNNNSAKEIQDKAQIVTSRIAGKAIEPPKEQSPPPAPPLLLQEDAVRQAPNKILASASAHNTKTESNPPLINQSFFSPPSNDQLLDGINGILAKMKANKEEKSKTTQNDDHEKKRSIDISMAHLS